MPLTFINAAPQTNPPVSALAMISFRSYVPGPGPATTSTRKMSVSVSSNGFTGQERYPYIR